MGRICFLLIVSALPMAYGQTFEVEGRCWFTRTNSQLSLNSLGISADLDLKNDLGIRGQSFPEVRATYSHGRSRFSFDFTPIRYNGDHNLSHTILYKGRAFLFGTRAISEFDVNYPRFSWTYFFLKIAKGYLKVGSLLEANGFLQGLSLKAPALGFSQNSSVSIGAPTGGLSTEFSARNNLKIDGELAGIPVGRYGDAVRGEAAVKYLPTNHLGFTAGYRLFDVYANYRPEVTHLRIHGPFVGASVRF